MTTALVILIIISLIIMTTLIASGIFIILKNKEGNKGKNLLIAGMISGLFPVILTAVLFFTSV